MMTRLQLHLLIICTLLTAVTTSVYLIRMKHHCQPEVVTQSIAGTTSDRYHELKQSTQSLQYRIEQHGTPDLLTFDPTHVDLADVSLFLLQDDQMIFWTDNRVPWNGEPLGVAVHQNPQMVKMQNGWYLVHKMAYLQYKIVGFSLIKHHYPYSNEYLSNTFHHAFNIRAVPDLSPEPTGFDVYDPDDNFLFGLVFDQVTWQPGNQGNIAFFLFLLSFILVNLLLLQLHRKFNPFPKKPGFPLLAFTADALIIRALVHYFRFPTGVHKTDFFNAQLYASSWLNPSFGDLILNGITVLLIIWACHRYGNFKPIQRPLFLKATAPGMLMIIAIVLIAAYTFLMRSLVYDSTLTFDFNQLLSADLYSLVGFIMMIVLSFSLILALETIFSAVYHEQKRIRNTILISLILLAFLLVRAASTNHPGGWITAVMFGSMMGVFLLLHFKRIKPFNFKVLLFVIVSACLTYMLNTHTQQKEQKHRMMIAADYAQKDDPMAEFLFGQAVEKLYQDTILSEMILYPEADEEQIINYILYIYFQSGERFWSKYHFQVTLCNPDHVLVIENTGELIDCYSFFEYQVQEYGRTTMVPDFILISDHMGQVNYLGVVRYDFYIEGRQESVRIFIELFPKLVPVDVGYLELLVDQSVKEKAGLAKYTNARYQDGQLIASYGKYNYSINLKQYGDSRTAPHFFSKGGYSHLFYPTGPDTVLIISKPGIGLLGMIAPFSLFLLIFLFIFSLSNVIRNRFSRGYKVRSNFKFRLQLTLFSVIVISFVVVGGTSVYYISVLNHNKNMDNLREKARSIRIEMEHTLANHEILDEEVTPYISQILTAFNDVFATDINLFDKNGSLLGSSRPRIFDEGLINNRMNTDAYREMVVYQKTLLIHEEQIGGLSYLSAYIPFKNHRGNIIAYINLPYFARQSELTDEISSFLMAFINIYLLLIAITLLYAFFISDMIAKPLILIREKIRRMKLGQINEKINWEVQDEIGELVSEYNRMIDELARSADLLARSERESAWREMARQVAHEIKNPLTPMKLNLQHLEKTLENDPELWRKQFNRFAKIMNEQIESLSTIASAFSDFANMPRGKKAPVELKSAIDTALELYSGYPEVQWRTHIDLPGNAMVYCDPEQLNRIMINLINNALQARSKDQPLVITVSAHREGYSFLLRVADNGRGIDPEIRDKIFLPSFTTKSSGMGLGLAIARNIAEGMGGDISFTTNQNVGTTFTVTIPVYEP